MKSSTFLLDTSVLIEYGRELEAGKPGPAHATLDLVKNQRVYISPVTVAELLEGSDDEIATMQFLAGFQALTIGWQTAKRCALNQSRATQRMSENDAWQAALAVTGGHTLVGHDRAFERRPWLTYLDYAKAI